MVVRCSLLSRSSSYSFFVSSISRNLSYLPLTIVSIHNKQRSYCTQGHNLSQNICEKRDCISEILDEKQLQKASLFIDTLLDWNQRMNLTAVTEHSAAMERHVGDSLALLPIIVNAYSKHCSPTKYSKLNIVDVGSGAGLPGMILAIARPDWCFTLIESIQKRCNFLEHVIQESGMTNVKVVRIRAEEAGQHLDYREQYDIAVARAVAEMRTLVEYCLPLVRVGGLFVAAKGSDPQDEVTSSKKAMNMMGASMVQLSPVESEGPYGQRTAVVCIKRHQTPKKYPRNVGVPAKDPL